MNTIQQIGIGVAIAILCGFGLLVLKTQHEEIQRLSSNQKISLQQYNTSLSEKTDEVKVLQLKAKEMKTTMSKITAKHVEEIGIKDKNIASLVSSVSKYKLELDMVTKDTAITRTNPDTGIDTIYEAKTFTYKDQYNDVMGYVFDNHAQLSFEGRDTITCVLGNKYDKKWFLPRFLEKQIPTAAIKNTNPKITIFVLYSFENEKRKR